MDKYEYKVRADEIKDLIAQGEYVQAAEIADTIDWRRVKSVMMLCTISDLYKINRRYEDARNMLLLAYERRPGGRTICYSLCELSIKMEDFVPAVNYYKEFVQVAPKDPGRYILQYKLYEAQDVRLEERIGVLEELKKRDYREKWAYELAYLYHRVGLATRCVEECDELILWFGEGKYVIKAMELKMLHQPLDSSQQEKYNHRFDEYAQPYYEPQPEPISQGTPSYYENRQEQIPQEQTYYAPEQAMESAYDVGGKTKIYEAVTDEMLMEQGYPAGQGAQTEPELFTDREFPMEQEIPMEQSFPIEQGFPVEQEYSTGFGQDSLSGQTDEMDIQVKPMDMGQYNTINLQAEIAAGLREVLEDDQKTGRGDEITRAIMAPMLESETESLDLPEIDEVDENDLEPETEVMEDSEVFFGETGEIGNIQSAEQVSAGKGGVREIVPEIGSVRPSVQDRRVFTETVQETASEREAVEVTVFVEDGDEDTAAEVPGDGMTEVRSEAEQSGTDATAETVMEQLKQESRVEDEMLTAQPPKEMARVLSQESDGQISFVMPESEQVEKQITGQMNLEDILVEWERMKQESAERRKEEVRQHVLRHTGEMFTAFEAAVRDGLLEQLEGDSAKEQQSLEGAAEKGISAEEDIAADEALQEVLYVETEADMPEEGQPEDNEDWDSPAEEEPEEELKEILREAEQEVIFGETDGVEELEEIQDIEEIEESDEPVEQAPAADEAEKPIEQKPEVVIQKPQTDNAGKPAEQGAEVAAQKPQSGEAGEPAEQKEEVAAQKPQSGEAGEPEGQESQSDDAGVSAEQGAEVAAQKPQPGEAEESAEQKVQPDKAGEPAEQKAQPDKAKKPAARKPEGNKAGKAGKEDGEQSSVEREKGKVRSLTKEEKELYGPYIQSRASREQLVQAIDSISMAAYTGNIIITGEEGMDTVSLAKNMIREVQMTDSNFAGKVAKISGQALNKKDVETTINQLASGALIIQRASGMDGDTVKRLHKALQQESFGIIIILEDVKKAMTRFLEQYPALAVCFTARMDVESLSNGTLVAFGRKYAREREYSIDDMGILALHTKIDEMQTSDHVVTVLEVKEIVDKAIDHANKKNLKHFFDILFARRYDEEDMIVLSERDFV